MSFSPTEAAFEGFRVVRRHPLVAVFWGLAYLLLFMAMFGVGAGQWATIMNQAAALEGSSEVSPAELAEIWQGYASLFVWAGPIAILLGAVLSAAVARSVLRPEQSAWGYLRLGMDEVRIVVVSLVVSILMGLASGVGFGVVSLVFALGVSTSQAILFLLALILGLALVALIVWLAVKLSLAVPMTLDRGKITIFESFKATKGRFWPLLGMAVIAVIMSLVVSLLGTVIGAAADLATGGIESLARYEGASSLEILTEAWPAILVWSIVNAFMSALQLAVLYAPFASAWQQIRQN